MPVIIEIIVALMASVILGYVIYRFAIRDVNIAASAESPHINGDLDHISEEAKRIREGAENIQRRISILRDLDESRRGTVRTMRRVDQDDS